MDDALTDDELLSLVAGELAADLDARAASFARRAASRIRVRALEARFPERRLFYVSSDPSDTRDGGAVPRRAPLLELSVAAGAGRELFDEVTDTWIEVPLDIPGGNFLALRVAGDSMVPLLAPRDVILVKLGASPVADDLIVAQRADDGYVVKRVARIGERELHLESLNPAYDPIVVPLRERCVLGTVIARFRET